MPDGETCDDRPSQASASVDLPDLKVSASRCAGSIALGKAVGATVYAGDFSMAGHAARPRCFGAPKPSARIVHLDVGKARALPGVAVRLDLGRTCRTRGW